LNLYEEEFRKDFEKACDKLGWSHYHVSGIEGIHDLLLFNGTTGLTVELKILEPKKHKHSVHNTFKPTQMPFYLNQISASKTPTFIAVKYVDDTITYALHQLKTAKDVIGFFASKWQETFDSNKTFSSPLSLIEYLDNLYGRT